MQCKVQKLLISQELLVLLAVSDLIRHTIEIIADVIIPVREIRVRE